MASRVILVITLLIGITFGQSTPPSSSTSSNPVSTPASWIDPHSTGKWGNPGARIHLCKKSMDAVHEYVSDMIARAILAMSVPDYVLNIGSGTLTVKSPRVTEAEYSRYEYDMVIPNQIRSRFFDGRLVASGVWQYKPSAGDLIGGTYKASFVGTELNVTNQLGRTADAKPMLRLIECKANISRYRIEVQGSDEIDVIEDCDMDVCLKIRKFFEDTICRLFEGFVKEVINRELQLVPTRMAISGDQYKIDYGLQYNEPTVNDKKCIRAGMEGKYFWRGGSSVPFNAPELDWVDNNRMYSMQLSDYTFNSLLHQAHVYGHKYSAADSLPLSQSPSMQQLLSLNCGFPAKPTSTPSSKPTSKPTTTPKPIARKYRGPPGPAGYVAPARFRAVQCLGMLFDNFTNFGPYSANDTGDIVYKTNQKASAVYVESEKRGLFDGSNGVLEIYGPMGQSGGSRPLLARVDVRVMRGEFIPKLDQVNITGSIKITNLQLVQQSGFRMITPEWLEKLAQFATPLLAESFNAFLNQYAQFPLPLPDKYTCMAPKFTVLARTMQLDCDIQQAQRSAMACRCIPPMTCFCG